MTAPHADRDHSEAPRVHPDTLAWTHRGEWFGVHDFDRDRSEEPAPIDSSTGLVTIEKTVDYLRELLRRWSPTDELRGHLENLEWLEGSSR